MEANGAGAMSEVKRTTRRGFGEHKPARGAPTRKAETHDGRAAL